MCMGLEKCEEVFVVVCVKWFLEEELNYIRYVGQYGCWSCNNQILEGCKFVFKDLLCFFFFRFGFFQ